MMLQHMLSFFWHTAIPPLLSWHLILFALFLLSKALNNYEYLLVSVELSDPFSSSEDECAFLNKRAFNDAICYIISCGAQNVTTVCGKIHFYGDENLGIIPKKIF